MNAIAQALKGLWDSSAFSSIFSSQEGKDAWWSTLPVDVGTLIMIAIACVLFYLAIVKKFEPLLLLPIAFGMLLTNIPSAMIEVANYNGDMISVAQDAVYHSEIFINDSNHIDWKLLAEVGGLID